jgi:exopolyphosphatase/guanosine-5'-triphosphate,3'-diphosphate pyrophosphatase
VTAIIPRWEFRTFGHDFGAAEASFAALTPGEPHDSDELYLLPRDEASTANVVKVRDDLMDVKALREVSADGLERWEPVFKVGFPIAAADVGPVLEALHLSPAPLTREAYTLDQLLDELVGPSGTVRTVRVHKRRVRYTVDGCMAELSDVTADGRPTRTIAIESEDPTAVVAAIDAVGLGDYLNRSYPRGLPAVLEGRPDRYAVIDVGTNSVKFHVGDRGDDGGWRTVVDRAEVTRLGEGLVEGGTFAPEAVERTIEAIAGMVDEAKELGALAIAAVGTAGLRMASDRFVALAALRDRTGLTVEVIPGEEESRLAYVAAQSALGLVEDRLVVFDTGGGSSQFSFGRGGRVDERFSVPVGAVRYTERFGLANAVTPEVLAEALAAIAADLARLDDREPPDTLVGMGGAVTNITAVKHGLAVYDPDVVQGTVLDRAEIDRQIELYRSRDAADRRMIVGLQPNRAEVILAGALIVRTVMEKLGQASLTVSDRGLRHGLLEDRFGSASRGSVSPGPAQR